MSHISNESPLSEELRVWISDRSDHQVALESKLKIWLKIDLQRPLVVKSTWNFFDLKFFAHAKHLRPNQKYQNDREMILHQIKHKLEFLAKLTKKVSNLPVQLNCRNWMWNILLNIHFSELNQPKTLAQKLLDFQFDTKNVGPLLIFTQLWIQTNWVRKITNIKFTLLFFVRFICTYFEFWI